MNEVIKEGNALISIKKTKKISKEMVVFYNPVMKLNRDVSILLLESLEKNSMQIALPLAATGIRGIRFLKELNSRKIKSISFNDNSKDAAKSIIDNLKLNKINGFLTIKNISNEMKNNDKISIKNRIRIYNEDANLFLLNSEGFDYIDIDPFGSSNIFLDAAVKRIARDGILAVTNTDTAALTGTYPKVCMRKYWAKPKLDYMMHETGLRILIRKIQLIGMQYEKALVPIFSYYKNHYFRVFFRCTKGKKECDKLSREHGMFNDTGPLWLGKLWDSKLANKMHSIINKNQMKNKKGIDEKNNYYDNELLRFLKIIKDESKIDAVGFFDTHRKGLKKTDRKEELIKKIRKKGHRAAETHFSGTGARTEYKI